MTNTVVESPQAELRRELGLNPGQWVALYHTFPRSPFDKEFDRLGFSRPAEDRVMVRVCRLDNPRHTGSILAFGMGYFAGRIRVRWDNGWTEVLGADEVSL